MKIRGVFNRCTGAAAIVAAFLAAAPSASLAQSTTSADAQKKIDALTKQLAEMQKQQAQIMSQMQEMKKQMDVKAVADAQAAAAAAASPNAAPSPAAPQTVAEHVNTIESDISGIRKDLATNLGVHIHGLMDAQYEHNFDNPGVQGVDKVNNYRAFDVDPSSFTFQQFQLHLDRTVDGGVGFVADINFGKVAEQLHLATHYSNNQGTSTEEVDPTQAYLTYTIPVGSGINLSAGKYVTLLGAEVIPTYNNLNYNISQGLLFTLGEPLTHTGVRANYAFTDKIALTLGVNNGWDDPADNNDGKSIEGELSLTPTSSLTMLLNGTYGPEQANHGNSKLGAIDPVITYKTPIPGLQLIGEYLYAHEDGPVVPAITPIAGPNSPNPLVGVPSVNHGVDWQGFAGYIVYDVNDKWELATRGEYFRDSDGIRSGIRQSLGEVTLTSTYKITDALWIRSEYRHDESNASPFFTNRSNVYPPINDQNGATPGSIYTISGQDTLATALIYTF
ncbi:MAG TPA: outer membrane beta-barrel protein [Candidatus Binataceae bacterium]|nr:outer membrane beta-barrel protein [Candidatus Binataceae bacterium]